MFIASVLKLLLYAAKRVLKVSLAVPYPSEGGVLFRYSDLGRLKVSWICTAQGGQKF